MNIMKTGMLLAAMTALFMGVGFLVGGSGGAVIALIVAAMMNLESVSDIVKSITGFTIRFLATDLPMSKTILGASANQPEMNAPVLL